MAPHLIAVMGPTASGKTAFAERLAQTMDAQLVNADAFQVYRGMDIGTAKPDDRTRYALLDLVEPSEDFSVGAWLRHALPLLDRLFGEGRNVVVVGGTGLYIRALMDEWSDLRAPAPTEVREELRQEFAEKGLDAMVQRLRGYGGAEGVDVRNPARVLRALERVASPSEPLEVRLPPFVKRKFGMDMPVAALLTRIEQRVDTMLAAGWLDEVRRLAAAGLTPQSPGAQAIGYRALLRVVRGELDSSVARERIVVETRRYAKRQRTWLRAEMDLEFLPAEDAGQLVMEADNIGRDRRDS